MALSSLHLHPRVPACLALLACLSACPGAPGTRPEEALARLGPGAGEAQAPRQWTAHLADELAPALDRARGRVVYVSTQAGNRDLWARTLEGGSPVRLTTHSADDFDPAVSPRGDRLAFASLRLDAKGDLFLAGPDGREVRRLTDRSSADRQPAFFPDGRRLAFTSARGSAPESIHVLELDSGARRPLSARSGFDPAVSPDGRFVLFTSRTEPSEGAVGGQALPCLWLHRLEDGRERPLHACDRPEGFGAFGQVEGATWVVWSRFQDDTRGDGAVDLQDRPSLWRQRLVEFEGPEPVTGRAVPLTSGTSSDIMPAVAGERVWYASRLDDDLDLWSVPLSGGLPPVTRAEQALQAAESTQDLIEALFVLRRCAADLAGLPDAERCALAEARRLLAAGRVAQAGQAYAALERSDTAPGVQAVARLGVVETEVLARLPLGLTPSQQREREPLGIALLERLELTGGSLAARLLLEADILRRIGRWGESLAVLERLRSAVDASDELRASGLVLEAEVMQVLGDGQAARSRLIEVVRGPARLGAERLRAARLVLALTRKEAPLADSGLTEIERLEELARQSAGLPLLPALVRLELGRLHLAAGRPELAARDFRRVDREHPDEPELVARALLNLSDLAEAQGDLGQALDHSVDLIERFPELREALGKARRRVRRLAGAHAEALLVQGESGMAIKVYRQLLAQDPDDGVAHRQLIALLAARGRAQEAVETYRERARSRPGDDLAVYLHGLALTYLDPPAHFDAAGALIDRALELNESLVFAHQTRAWLLEQRTYQRGRAGGQELLIRAAEAYQTALALLEARAYPRAEADLLLNLGNVYHALGNHRRAHQFYRRREQREVPFAVAERRLVFLEQFGRSAFLSDELADALRAYGAAAALARELGRGDRLARILAGQAAALQLQGRHAEAAELFREVCQAYLRQGVHERLASCQRNVAYNLFMQGRAREAAEAFAEAAALLARHGTDRATEQQVMAVGPGAAASRAAMGFDRQGELNFLATFQARIHREAGDARLAGAALRQKIQLLEGSLAGGPTGGLALDLAIALNHQAVLELEQGDPLAAEQGFQRSGALSAEAGSGQGVLVNALNGLRLVLEGRVATGPAQAVVALEAVRARLAAGLAIREESWVRLLAGLAAARVAEAERPTVASPGAPAERRLEDAGLELDRLAGLLRAAEADLREARARAAGLAGREGARLRVQVAISLGGVLSRLGRAEQASAVWAEARALVDGLALWDLGWRLPDRPAEARARELFDLPSGWACPAGDGAAAEARDRLLGGLTERALAAGQPGEAFTWSEALRLHRRSGALTIRQLRPAPGEPDSARELDRDWLGQLDMHAQLLQRTLEGLTPELGAAARSALLAQAGEQLQAWRECRERGGRPRALLRDLLGSRSPPPEELARLLAPGEAILTAMLLPDGLALFWLDSDGVLAERVPASPAEVRAQLGRLRGSLAAEASGARAQLSAWLLKPFEERLGACQGLIAVSDDLGLSPAMLVFRGRALIQSMPVSQLHAAADLVWARRQRTAAPERAVWVGREPAEPIARALRAGFGALTTTQGSAEEILATARGAGLVVFDLPLRGAGPRTLKATFELVPRLGSLAGLSLESLARSPQGHGLWLVLGGRPGPDGAEGPALGLGLLGAEVPTAVWLPLEADPPWARELLTGFLERLAGDSPAEALRASLDRALGAGAPWRALLDVQLRGDAGLDEAGRKQFAQRELGGAVQAASQAFQARRWAEALSGFLKVRRLALYLGQAGLLPRVEQAIVQSAFQLEDYPLAVEVERRILEQARAAGEPLAVARAHGFLGVLLSRAERHAEAFDELGEALRRFDALGARAEAAQVQANLALALDAAARYPESVRAAQDALGRFEALGDGEQRLRMLRTLGATHLRRLHMTAAARDWFERALEAARALGQPTREAEVGLDLVRTELAAGAYETALERAREAEAVYLRLGDRRGQAEAALEQAGALWYLGEYQRAFLAQRQAMGIAEELEDLHLGIRARSLGGLIALNLGDLSGAERALEHALRDARRAGNRAEEATQLNNLGIVARERGELGLAVERFQAALKIDEALKSVLGRAYDLRNLGLAEQRMGRLDEAGRHLQEALELSSSVRDVFNEVKARVGLANLEQDRGRLAEAALQAEQAHRLSVETGLREVAWRALRILGQVALKRGEALEARRHFEAAIQLVEEMRASLKVEEFRAGFLDSKYDLYEDMVHLLVSLGEAEQAFSFTERARARGFLDLLANRQIEVGMAGDQALLERLRLAREALAPLSEAVRRAPDEERDAAEAALQAARQTYLELVEQVRQAQPDLADFIEVRPVAAEEVRARLPEDVALVSYYVTGQDVLAFVLRQDRLSAHRLALGRAEVNRRVTELRSLVERFAPAEAELQALYRELVAPLEAGLAGARAVCVLPHDALNYLPFAALMPGADGFWSDSVELFFGPSASVLLQLVRREEARFGPGGGLLSLGNPDLGDPALALPFAEHEAEAVVLEQGGGELLVGSEASEAAFLASAGRADFLHLACHGTFDPQSPLFSALQLAPGGGQDGVLTAMEVFGLPLSARLVTLSACQTGLGDLRQGDELVGFNRAFLSAGAGAILSSLWRVSDVASAVLMKRFYRALRSLPPAAALREAQRVVRRYYPHPAYWAAFHLIGTWR
jgi:CHAT domain-containing protein